MPTGHYLASEYRRNRKRLVYATWAHKRPCWLCGLPFKSKGDITADHVIPICRGGTHAYSNLRPAHGKCNNERVHDDIILSLGVLWAGQARVRLSSIL